MIECTSTVPFPFNSEVEALSVPTEDKASKRIESDTHSDYHQAKNQANESMTRGVWTERFDPRFVPFSEREMKCDLPKSAFATISHGKHFMSYRGLSLAKNPFDLTLYSTLFFEVQPRTVIELGAYTGASALWMADTLKTYGLDSRVIAVDIDLALIDGLAKQEPSIEFRQGDCNEIESLFPAEELAELPHPLVLIDDAHVNVEGVYRHFHQHAMRTGDYLIIEDTVPWIPGTFGQSEDDQEWGDWKFREISRFFADEPTAYAVDRYYTDFYGYNATWNWNGFLRRQ